MNLMDAIDHMRPAIVQITVVPDWSSGPRKPSVVGTGFWVHKNGLAMTAKHVAESARNLMANSPGSRLMLGQSIPSITSPQITIRGSLNYIESRIVEEDQRHDIALIEAAPNPFATEQRPFVKTATPETDVYPLLGHATLSTSEVRDGEQIAVSGYPLEEPALVTTSGGIASAFGTDIQQALGAPPGFTMPNIAGSYLVCHA